MRLTLGKANKLCSKKEIDHVFSRGKKMISPPFLFFTTLKEKAEDGTAFKILISIPKKNIKKAHDRNYIRRCVREGLRINKQGLVDYSEQHAVQINLCMVYIWKEVLDSAQIQIETQKVIQKICKK